MIIVYEQVFDWNEWFVIISFITLCALILMLPKIFPLLEGIAYFIIGVLIGNFFDHTISIQPWDFYDVNDSSAYQAIDFLSYIMYGPFSYFFMYLYVKFNISGISNLFYILAWSCFAFIMEWIGVKIGLFHFEKGYLMYWSIPIYFVTQTLQIIFFNIIKFKS
ncbi:hypothetical protein PY093_15775 [Cytobacillus sp. S13-E01]|uniref:hypothetical protein n=1 Tax=Cytobacillus sp. S13-E01 TaxID=3031326 RepID=UPI0023D8001E|nr:hypothetical protein [Cytobacillus sp. S13-E01]MDF0728128.1 hypothetical protein [Cytobacillus sp. S13-E01]